MARPRRIRLPPYVLLLGLVACKPQPSPAPSRFGLDERPANPTCLAPARPPLPVPVKLEHAFANVSLQHSMVMAQIPGDRSRWFVAERMGPNGADAPIVSFDATHPEDQPSVVATLGPLAYVDNDGQEGGLLGMAFHPRFGDNGRLYVSWVKKDSAATNGVRSAVGYLTSRDHGAHFSGYRELFAFDQTASPWHKGGCLQFGADGLLYASFGDGGGQDDAFHNGQNPDGFFAKIHRIDVDHEENGKPYAIPEGNPFKRGGGQDTTFAIGLRNPFRFSIDRATNQLWAGDVGGARYEEVDLVRAGGNYGWPCREGFHDLILPPDPRCPSLSGLSDPLTEHPHGGTNGGTRAIIGGVVYRGKALPALVGTYFYGDYARQELWALRVDSSTGAVDKTWLNEAGPPAAGWVDFAEDADGEIYVLSLDGQIYRVVAADNQPDTFPRRLSQTGCVDPNDPRVPIAGVIPYGVQAPLWSDGADKQRWLALPDGATIDVLDDGKLALPIGTVLMKTFSLDGAPVETRLFIRHGDGAWAGYTYEWLDDHSDALLLPGSKLKSAGAQSWYYPARSECLLCHSEAAGRSVGLELGQLDGELLYPSTHRVANQLETLDHIGLFTQPLGARLAGVVPVPDPLGHAPVDARARAYLNINCAICHQPSGNGIVNMDLRSSTALAGTQTCDVDPTEGDLGIAGAKRLAPGAPERSLLSIRPHSLSVSRMPPLASSVVDAAGTALIDDWILGLTTCP
jgi:uncharacterized repeat protein (TIGR03806 family)